MKKITAVIAFFFVFAVHAHAFEIIEVKSKGGLTAWLVEDKTIPLIAMNFAFDGGSTSDAANKEGTAHFITGLMDEGSGELNGESFQAKRDALGIRISFSAAPDKFYGSLQTLSKHRFEAFSLLRMALVSPKFPNEAVERMRQQFIVSAQGAEQDPQTIAYREAIAMMLPNHVYTRPSRGSPQSLAAVSRDDIIAAHKAIFTTKGLKISVVGDITEDELALILDSIFGGLPSSEPPAPAVDVNAVSQSAIKIIQREMPQSVVVFAGPGIKHDDPAFFPAFVMSHILGSGSSSWLGKEVREKRGLTYGISYNLMPLEHTGLYLGSFSTVNAKAGEAMNAVRSTIRRMATEGPTQEDLDHAKTYLTGSYALRFDSNENIADVLLSQQVLNRSIDFVKNRNSLIEEVTLEQVKEQAHRLLDPDKLVVIAVGKPEDLK
jgi:zinc protease